MCLMEKFKTLMKEFQGDKIVQRQDQKLLEKGARQVTILKWDFPQVLFEVGFPTGSPAFHIGNVVFGKWTFSLVIQDFDLG